MKKILSSILILMLAGHLSAQIGATAPDFTVIDIDGNEISLYEDILDQGLIAVVDVSATWCGPCWNLHTSHALEDLNQAYGPNGTNQLRVIFYEGDDDTTMDDLEGNTGSSYGNWLEGITYPVVNEDPLSLNLSIWAPLGFPTVNVIQPSDGEIVADTWNIFSLEGQVDAINSAVDGVTLDPVSVEEQGELLEVNAFPNPVANELTLQFDQEIEMIEMYNLVGELVYSEANVQSIGQHTIPVKDIENGMYMLKVYGDQTESTTLQIQVLK